MIVHNVKLWTEYFHDALTGQKSFEVRRNDRDYREGDLLILWEYNRASKTVTGGRFVAKVGHVVRNFPGLKKGWCVFGLVRPDFQDMKTAMVNSMEPS